MSTLWASQNSFLFNDQREEAELMSSCPEKEQQLADFDFNLR
jgi:hypothetical protein